ncbi:hypothetical protein V4F39_24940 [Aquincola sp. MAHUQ-54]|uniref:Patatin-like phospholipase n=1 Tax=Aquincola agrisoli TaxID=3119538 RepID=A0AAW9QD68_9BURK
MDPTDTSPPIVERRQADVAGRRRERAALLHRRRAASRQAAQAGSPKPSNDTLRHLPTVGLALSGGGVRSATYGLGLIRGLAQRGLLARLDYLSTVAGGGYVGAMLGRLVMARGIANAQAMLAARRSPLLDWLRRNGRYLSPAGTHDVGVAAVTYLRAFVAMHGELMMAGLLFGLLIVSPHLWQQGTGALDPNAWHAWGSLWFPIAAAWGCAALPGLACGYWVAREGPDPTRRPRGLSLRNGLVSGGLILCTLAAAWLAWRLGLLRPLREGAVGLPLALLALASVAGGVATSLGVLATSADSSGLASARLRRRFTEAMSRALGFGTLLVAMGVLDLVSWHLLKLALSDRDWLWGGLGLGGFMALVLRALTQPLQQLVAQATPSLHAWWPRLLDAAGLLVLAVVSCFWLSTVQWIVFTSAPLGWLQAVPAPWRALGLLAVCLGWWLATSGNTAMANASSLHGFYRARLTRAYLAVGNPHRPVLDPQAGATASDVTQVVSRDDADLRDYRPERSGGPLHLINTCLSQTRDDASGLYNADRKGVSLTVRADGIELGPRGRVDFGADSEVGTLGKWIAISGAAAAPDGGAALSRGWALLRFLLGVRLGYWVRDPLTPAKRHDARIVAAWRVAAKPLMLWSEAAANFFGAARPWWYLCDGGHFDNTGVYALLRREVDFIVLVDASCDPRYEFSDLESLVRKARIDFGAEIEFYPHDEATQRFGLADAPVTVLSPQDMADSQSARGVLLARIRYLRPEGAGPAEPAERHGTLLVIKPNLHAALDVDVLAYAQRRPAFPHESTGDQTFDEAQWESYHRLGEDAGAALRPDWLARLPGWTRRIALDLDHPARLQQPRHGAPASAPPDKEPAWRRATRNTALGTTIGLSASGTLLLSLWQVGDQLRQNEASQRSEVRQLFTDLSRTLSDLDPACPKVPAHVTPQITLLQDLVQSPAVREIDRVSVQRLLEHTREQCTGVEATPSETCVAAQRRMQDSLCAAIGKPQVTDALSYWHPFETPPGRLLTWPRFVDAVAARWQRGRPPPIAAAAPPAPSQPGVVAPGPAPASEPSFALAACSAADGAPLRLYLQVYDETSRSQTAPLRVQLQTAGGAALQVAPIENVSRSARLRQQRRPVPWPQPTLVVHQPGDNACARAMVGLVRSHWRSLGRSEDVWISELPASLRGRSSERVIELWLPPSEGAPPRMAGG